MGYPIITPPVHASVVFGLEKTRPPSNEDSCLRPLDPAVHPLFGIALHKYSWPEHSEYQAAYCDKAASVGGCGGRGGRGASDPQPSCGSRPDPWHHDPTACRPVPRLPVQRGGQALDRMYSPTPLPLVDKHYRTNYYRIGDPIGTITCEEVSKCRETILGPQKISVNDEFDDAYIPNYRYKEWLEQPQIEILRQLDTPSLICRLPEPDTRHWDLYNQVRMHRPSPKISSGTGPFMACPVVPIPRNFAQSSTMPPVDSLPHFGKFNNFECTTSTRL